MNQKTLISRRLFNRSLGGILFTLGISGGSREIAAATQGLTADPASHPQMTKTSDFHKPVIAFDIYGTLIDPYSIEDHLRDKFGAKAREATELLRDKQIEYSFRRALMKRYKDFGVCTAQALDYVGARMGVSLSEDDKRKILDFYRVLPAFPDVAPVLDALQKSGYELVAFSNGNEKAVRTLLEHASIIQRFSDVISVDEIRSFKPDPAVYEHLAKRVDRPKESVWLVSSNAWDVIGAKSYGLRAAWLWRDPSRIFDPWEFSPDVILPTLIELPAKLQQMR